MSDRLFGKAGVVCHKRSAIIKSRIITNASGLYMSELSKKQKLMNALEKAQVNKKITQAVSACTIPDNQDPQVFLFLFYLLMLNPHLMQNSHSQALKKIFRECLTKSSVAQLAKGLDETLKKVNDSTLTGLLYQFLKETQQQIEVEKKLHELFAGRGK